jgi:hypothetical protein
MKKQNQDKYGQDLQDLQDEVQTKFGVRALDPVKKRSRAVSRLNRVSPTRLNLEVIRVYLRLSAAILDS